MRRGMHLVQQLNTADQYRSQQCRSRVLCTEEGSSPCSSLCRDWHLGREIELSCGSSSARCFAKRCGSCAALCACREGGFLETLHRAKIASSGARPAAFSFLLWLAAKNSAVLHRARSFAVRPGHGVVGMAPSRGGVCRIAWSSRAKRLLACPVSSLPWPHCSAASAKMTVDADKARVQQPC